jgi:hypothetical protein
MKTLTAADVIRIHEEAMGQLIPAIRKGLPYSQLIEQACWLSYEIGLVADERVAQYPEAVQDLIDQIRDSGSLERLPIAKPWKRYIAQIVRAGHETDDVEKLRERISRLQQPVPSDDLERFLGDLLPGFAISSAQTVATYAEASEGDGGGGIDGGEVIEEDIKGAVIGALAGFGALGIIAVGGGPVGGAAAGAATAGAAVVGGLVGSGVKYLEEDAARDAIGKAVAKMDSGGGNNPWEPGDSGGGGRWEGWHDGDGYGLG